MQVQDIGLEHFGVMDKDLIKSDVWEGSVQLCGSGSAFTFCRSLELSNAIRVSSDGPFRVTARRKDGSESTVFSREDT